MTKTSFFVLQIIYWFLVFLCSQVLVENNNPAISLRYHYEKLNMIRKLSYFSSQLWLKVCLLMTMCIYAAAAAKSLQLCLTLCNPIDGSPPGFPTPRILQARTQEWVAISFSIAWKWKVKVKLLSCTRLLATTRTAAYQASLSMDFPGKSTGVGCHCLLWCVFILCSDFELPAIVHLLLYLDIWWVPVT